MKNSKTMIVITALCVGLGAGSIASAKVSSDYYTLKGEARTGSKIPSVDAKSALPFNKRYFELSDAEKELFRARFANISKTEIPPFPSAGLKAIYRPLIDQSKKASVRGRLSLSVMVNENGEVTDLKVIESPNDRITAASKRILLNTQFDPAFCNGEPCKMEFPVSIKFI